MNDMAKIFFFDIDSTLLDHNTNAIPTSALEAIADLKKAGHTIIIATGRGFGDAKPYIDMLEPTLSITQNGARIMRGDEVLLKKPLAHDTLLELFDWMYAQGYHYGINDGVKGCVSGLVDDVMIPMDSVDVGFNSNIAHYRDVEIFQGWLYFNENLDNTLLIEIKEKFPQFDFVRWHETAMDVLPKGVNKLTACQWVMNELGFDVEQSYAFGDGLNDVEMIQGVGTGIAMGNAHEHLKSVADRVADAIHDDGLAKMIRLLEREWA